MYITVSEIAIPQDILIKLTDDEGAGAVNTARAEAAITSAQALVDSSLSRLYSTPVAGPPDIVKKMTSDIAVYNLYQRAGEIPEGVRAAYAATMTVLEKASRGEICIVPDAPGHGPEFSYQDREFTREYMEGF